MKEAKASPSRKEIFPYTWSTTIWGSQLASCSKPNTPSQVAHFECCPVLTRTLPGKELLMSGRTWGSLPPPQQGKPEGTYCPLYFSARLEHSRNQVCLHSRIRSVTAFGFLSACGHHLSSLGLTSALCRSPCAASTTGHQSLGFLSCRSLHSGITA